MPYTFDSTGTALQNMVIGEEITITAKTTTNFLFVLPAQGPYFWDSLAVKLIPAVGDAVTLLPGVDFNPGYQYFEATARCNRMIAGAIQLVNVNSTGKLLVKYNCVGGGYTPTASQIDNIRANEKRDPMFTTWEMVCGDAGVMLPSFPTMDQVWGGLDDSALTKTIEELERLGLVVQIRPNLLSEPTSSVFIPTKAEIGLGNVPNYPVSTEEEARAGTHHESLMTPLRTSQAIETQIKEKLSLIGLAPPTPYENGLALDTERQTIIYNNEVYAPRKSCLPFVTTGSFAVDKDKLVLLNTGNRDHWKSYNFTLTGNEIKDPITGCVLINTGLVFDSDIDTKLIIYPVAELIRGIDFHLHKGMLKLMYPTGAGDELTFYYKRKSALVACDRPYHHVIKVSDGVKTFQLPDFDVLTPDDLRVTMNDFAILRSTIDYNITTTGTLNVTFPLKLNDVLEVVNQDAIPMLGVLQTRGLLYSI